ncbi:MAG: di-heme oxidoredictase family protein [Dongiaceae bacterium]
MIARGRKAIISCLLAGLVSIGGLGSFTSSSAADDTTQRQPQSPMRRSVQADPQMPSDLRMDFELGAGLFKRNWVAAPSSTQAVDGLGPLYNARSCNACHPGGARSHDLVDQRKEVVPGLTVHLGRPGNADAGAVPDPLYGEQIQTQALPGQTPEARIGLIKANGPVISLAGGEQVQLRYSLLALSDLAYGALDPATTASLRLAPAINGLGLIERIPAADILVQAERLKPDGIAGRPNWITDPRSGEKRLGRFGWKAIQPDIAQQNAHAFSIDIGMSTTIFPAPAGDCMPAQGSCLAAPDGRSPQFGNVEIAEAMRHLLDVFVSYATLPTPGHTGPKQVAAGERLFAAAGCGGCHRPGFDLPPTAGEPARKIAPYSDLLLHDMGAGLADGIVEGKARGNEWRTAPLWGLGQAAAADGPAALLHDGRARSILEAILWHGGEAKPAQQRVVAMSPAERRDLIAFLRSL